MWRWKTFPTEYLPRGCYPLNFSFPVKIHHNGADFLHRRKKVVLCPQRCNINYASERWKNGCSRYNFLFAEAPNFDSQLFRMQDTPQYTKAKTHPEVSTRKSNMQCSHMRMTTLGFPRDITADWVNPAGDDRFHWSILSWIHPFSDRTYGRCWVDAYATQPTTKNRRGTSESRIKTNFIRFLKSIAMKSIVGAPRCNCEISRCVRRVVLDWKRDEQQFY